MTFGRWAFRGRVRRQGRLSSRLGCGDQTAGSGFSACASVVQVWFARRRPSCRRLSTCQPMSLGGGGEDGCECVWRDILGWIYRVSSSIIGLRLQSSVYLVCWIVCRRIVMSQGKVGAQRWRYQQSSTTWSILSVGRGAEITSRPVR